jgi:hypothetical protein
MSVPVLFHNHTDRTPDAVSLKFFTEQAKKREIIMGAEMGWIFRRRMPSGATLFETLHEQGFDAFANPFHDYTSQTPILFQTKRWEIVDARQLRHYPETDVGSWGAGPPIMGEGWTTAAGLADKDHGGRVHWFLDAHFVPSVTQTEATVRREGGAKAVEGWKKRRELHALEAEGTADLASEIMQDYPRSPLSVWADFNAGPTYPSLKALRGIGLTPVFPGPTMKGRKIDGGWTNEHLKVLTAGVLPPVLRGEHSPVWASLQFVA